MYFFKYEINFVLSSDCLLVWKSNFYVFAYDRKKKKCKKSKHDEREPEASESSGMP